MSHLRLYAPDDTPSSDEPYESPATLPFRRFASRPMRLDAITRARVIYENRQCPFCDHTAVEPVELEDAIISPRSRLPIPGTSTIVGFHCSQCESEWPIYRVSEREVS